MEKFCVSCKKYTGNKNSSGKKTKQNRLIILSNCAIYDKKNPLLLKIKKLIVFQMISLK